MARQSDRQLVLQLQQGDLDALGALYDRHHLRVFRTALGITNDQEAAADLLQDVFLRINRFSHRIDPDRPLEPWLYRVTANLAYSWLKRRSRWYRYLLELGDWLTRDRRPGPQKQLEMAEEVASLRKAVAGLPLQQRTVVVLYYMNGVSVEDIARILEIPEGTVKSRLHYARRALRESLLKPAQALPQIGYEYN